MSAFLFLRKVAEGPATEVFLVHQDGSPGRRAVELLRSDLTDQPELVGRFLGEAELRIRESDPRLLAWVQVGRTPGEERPFLISEPLPSECLRTRLLKRGPLNLAEAMELGQFLCQALRARGPHPHGKLFPEGVLLARDVDPRPTLTSRFNRAYERAMTASGLTRSSQASDRLHFRRPPEWERALAEAGFGSVRSRPCSHWLFADVLYTAGPERAR